MGDEVGMWFRTHTLCHGRNSVSLMLGVLQWPFDFIAKFYSSPMSQTFNIAKF